MKYIIYIFILLSLCSCLNEGTDTGNPGAPASGTPPANGDSPGTVIIIPTGSRLDELANAVCYQLSACEADPLLGCANVIYEQTNIDEEIGLSVGDFTDLNAVATANNRGDITLDGIALDQCKTDIYAISCSQPEVVNAYDPDQSNPYEGVADMLPTSCEGIF